MSEKKTELGSITESLPNLCFRVQLDSGAEIMAYTAGKMRLNRIRMMVGDKVMVELDPYGGKASNRIIRRL